MSERTDNKTSMRWSDGRILLSLAMLLAGLAGVSWLGEKTKAALAAENAVLEARRVQVEQRLAQGRVELERWMMDETQAVRQLEELRALLKSPLEKIGPEQAQQVRLIVERVQWLRKVFAERPELQIPEMALMTDIEWLAAAKFASLENEEGLRKAMAEVRQEAKKSFAIELEKAVKKYVAMNGKEWPKTTAVFAPYFAEGVDPAILHRYEIAQAFSFSKDDYSVQERVSVDPKYELFTGVLAEGGVFRFDGVNGWRKSKNGLLHKGQDVPVVLPTDWSGYLLKQGE